MSTSLAHSLVMCVSAGLEYAPILRSLEEEGGGGCRDGERAGLAQTESGWRRERPENASRLRPSRWKILTCHVRQLHFWSQCLRSAIGHAELSMGTKQKRDHHPAASTSLDAWLDPFACMRQMYDRSPPPPTYSYQQRGAQTTGASGTNLASALIAHLRVACFV